MRTSPARSAAAAALALIAAATPARAEEDAGDTPLYRCKKPPEKARMTVSLKPDTTLPELAVWITAFTCKNVVYSSDVACRAVTVITPSAISPSEAQELFSSAAEAMGLKVTTRGNTLVITEVRPVKCPAPPAAAQPPAKEAPAKEAPARPPSSNIDLELDDLVRNDGGEVEVSRRLIEAFVADPDIVAGSMRIVPAFSDGKASGFKLYAIRASSIPAKLGLMNGDTVSSIGGIVLITVDDALDAFTRLKNAHSVRVELVRKGKPLTLEYKIR